MEREPLNMGLDDPHRESVNNMSVDQQSPF
jgi:hypothetical protein